MLSHLPIRDSATEANVSIPVGIAIGLLASFVQSLGLTIQRKSHVVNELLPLNEQRVEHRRPMWLLGFAIFISSNVIGSLVQIASLPVVILAPLGAVSLLWNAFFARLLLGDTFSIWMILGTLLIAGGAVLIAVFGIVDEPIRSLEDLLALFSRPTFVVYFSLLGLVVIVSLAITHFIEYRLSKRTSRSSHDLPPTQPHPPITHSAPEPTVLATGPTDVILDTATERTPLLDPKSGSTSRTPSIISQKESRASGRTRLLLAISYASFSGILSGMCLLFAKSGVELLLLTLRGQPQFWRWQAWMLVLGLVAFALLQLWYLHKALTLADPTLVCPSAFCFYNLSSIVNGLVYFDQVSLISPLHLCLVGLGIVVLLGGVWVVSIHSGGDDVDAAIWDDELCEDEEQVLMADSTARPESLMTPVSSGFDWGASAESRMSPGADTSLEFGSGGPLSPLSTISSPLPSQSPMVSPRISHHARHTTTDSYDGLRRLHRTTSAGFNGGLGAPQSTVAALAGAGFQIGLSPVSPGFSVVPRDRRAPRTSLLGLGSPPIDNLNRGSVVERRRTVSEGDMRIKTPSSRPNLDPRLEEDVEQAVTNVDATGSNGDNGRRGGRRQSTRWKWLRKLGGKD